MNPFRLVVFDIVNYCNAKCPYCITGASNHKNKDAISVELFLKTLKTLFDKKVIDSSSIIYLYSWGESLLHPDLGGIVENINSLNLKYVLSTNASIVPKVTKGLIKNLHHLIISMPGFSQKSYDRISQLNFERVKENIIQLVRSSRAVGFKKRITITYHVYQFNVVEMYECERLANKYGIFFNPNYAIINEWQLLQGWLNGGLSDEEKRRIGEDIFCFNIREKMENSPQDYHCPQHDYLVIDEKANVVVCCQVPKDNPEFLCGNILRDDIETIMTNKKNRLICNECINSGLSYYLNNSLIWPEFYKKDNVQISFRGLIKLFLGKFYAGKKSY